MKGVDYTYLEGDYGKDGHPRAPFVLRALFGVRATFTIHVAETILVMDCLFQIISYRLFVSDNICFI